MSKKINRLSSGLLLLIVVALLGAPGVLAFPTQNVGCDNCHAYPPTQVSITTNITAITVSPGQQFTVKLDWSGGGTVGTAIKWPDVLNNGLFTINPVLPVNGVATSGTTSSTLTAPAAAGDYTVRVYVATDGPWETDYKDIAVTVQPPPVANGTIAGTITNASSSIAISGATVTAGGISATTDANGNYSISIAPGTYTVTASATGYVSGTMSNVIVASNAITTATLALAPVPPSPPGFSTVTFVVIDNETGLPVDEAKVTMDGVTIETDDAGTAVFTKVAAGDHTYEVSGEDYVKTNGIVSVAGDTTVTVKLTNADTEEHHKGDKNKKDKHNEEENKENNHGQNNNPTKKVNTKTNTKNHNEEDD